MAVGDADGAAARGLDRNMKVASPPTRMKPDTGGEATGTSSHRTFRGGWGQRAWIDQSRSLGGPAGWEFKATNALREYITVVRPSRESERPIIAKKRGNVRGAKGPY